MPLVLRPLRTDELAEAHALCLRSKAYWGYDATFMKACREELRVTAADLEEDDLAVIGGPEGLAGLVQVSVDGTRADLEKLFIAPDHMGQGVGRRLYEWALNAARGHGAQELVIDADPDAAAFYRRMGAVPAGMVPSGSIEGRMLPRLVHQISG